MVSTFSDKRPERTKTVPRYLGEWGEHIEAHVSVKRNYLHEYQSFSLAFQIVRNSQSLMTSKVHYRIP